MVFSSLSFASWIKAVLRPYAVLGIPTAEVHNFQISALVLMNHVWLARNKLIFDNIQLVPFVLLKLIHLSSCQHLYAWQTGKPKLFVWVPPPMGSYKVNFDVAIRSPFAVAVVLRDHSGNFLAVDTLKLPVMDATLGEAHAALLASRLAVSYDCSSLVNERDSLLTILAIIDPQFFVEWNIAPIVFHIQL